MGERIRAMSVESLKPGEMKAVSLMGRSVLLVNLGGEVFATSNVCTHEEAYLNDGRLQGGVVVCPLHDSEFDIRTGEALLPPAENPLPVYKVSVENGQVYVELP